MKRPTIIFILLSITLLSQSSCQKTDQKNTILQQCRILGSESILYARANYVKLFYTINPEKFSESYQQIKDFDQVAHRNTIRNYETAVQKLKASDPVSKSFLQSCKNLAKFSIKFVDENYPRAISLKKNSKLDPLTDEFFLKINKIVKFDHSIGQYEINFVSFKQHVKNYETALKNYIEKFRDELVETIEKK